MTAKYLSVVILLLSTELYGQKSQQFEVTSPNGKILIQITAAEMLQWSVKHQGQDVLLPSTIAMHLQDGQILGKGAKIASVKRDRANGRIKAINYKKSEIEDVYNQLILNFRGDYGVIFRAYDDGVAYRFFARQKKQITVINETANFNFSADHNAYIPYAWDYRDGQ